MDMSDIDMVGAYDAKTHLPALLDEVAAGKSVVITRHRVPVARLVPADPTNTAPPEQTVAALRAARHGVRRGDLSVQEMIAEGRS